MVTKPPMIIYAYKDRGYGWNEYPSNLDSLPNYPYLRLPDGFKPMTEKEALEQLLDWQEEGAYFKGMPWNAIFTYYLLRLKREAEK